MLLSDFNYELPAELIAQRPLEQRDASRLLILDREKRSWEDSVFRTLPERLRGDELVVINDVRVIPARLLGRRVGVHAERPGRHSRSTRRFLSSEIEVLLTRRVSADEWEALVRPGRKVRVGERVEFGDGGLVADVVARGELGQRRVRLSSRGDLQQAIEHIGHVPLPPYIARSDEAEDRERYQTIFAQHSEAVAAPTAALHFSAVIVEQMKQRGIEMVFITLEVGLGTFQPIHAERLEQHRMHRERYEISEQAASAICRARREGRPVLAIGTTVVRALEDAAEKARAKRSAISNGSHVEPQIEPGWAEAEMFITPGHRFQVVDQLLTNFHLPRSTLLVLVCAFAGRGLVLDAYHHAIDVGYRFYSYGDCMWIR